MKHSRKIFISLALISIFLPLISASKTQAAGASLYLSPASGTKYTGDKFNIFVYVSASQAVNTFDVYLSSNNITVTGVASGGSICVLFPNPPSYTNSTARFKCGLPTPGYTGNNGYIGAITVQAGSPGTGRSTVDSPSSVLANDGAGTNVLGSRGTATFTIQPRPTSAPSITSPTHPDQDKWYKGTSPTLNWTGNGSNFSYALDQNPDTNVDEKSEGTEKTKTFENLADGIWYFHVKVLGSNNAWSSTAHYKIQIDKTPPEKFTPEADPKKDADKRPIIAFTATDKTSGIDHYELKVDEGTWTKIDNPYKLPKISSGKHTIHVKAVDKAGNETIGQVEITVKQIPIPEITKPKNNSTLPYGNELWIKGKATPNFDVKLYLNGKEIATVKTDKNGNFEFRYKELLKAGKHELYAVAINSDQIESSKSELVKFNIDPKAYVIFGFAIPGLVLLTSLFAILLIFIFIIFFLLLGAKRFRRKLQNIIEELEQEVDKDLERAKIDNKVKKEIDEDFEEAEKKVDN